MPLSLIPQRRVSNWSLLIDGNHPRRSLTSSCSVYQRAGGEEEEEEEEAGGGGRQQPRKRTAAPRLWTSLSFLASSVAALGHHAAERAVPRPRQQRRRWPGLLEPRIAVPQPVTAQGVPDTDEDHAGSGCLSDGPGEPHPGRELCGSGSHHLTQGPPLVSVLGGLLCEYMSQASIFIFH